MNGMALIRTLMVSTTAFRRTKEKLYGFWQTELIKRAVSNSVSKEREENSRCAR